jgi:intracellular septation protein
MQSLSAFLPLIAFYVGYKLAGNDFFVATGVLIVVVLAQVSYEWLRHRKVSSMLLVTAVLVLIFGGLTLVIHDKIFLQWKFSIVNWLFASAFLASHFFGDRPLVQRIMGENVTLERGQWLRLSWAWIVYFAVMGALNLYVAYNFAESVWVNFKLYGTIGLTVLFALAQGFWLASKMPAEGPSR